MQFQQQDTVNVIIMEIVYFVFITQKMLLRSSLAHIRLPSCSIVREKNIKNPSQRCLCELIVLN